MNNWIYKYGRWWRYDPDLSSYTSDSTKIVDKEIIYNNNTNPPEFNLMKFR